MPKNKARSIDSYRHSRRENTRTAHARILIVCEGEKTEPNYFEAIRQKLRLPSVDIRVMQSSFGTAPKQVVDCALETLEKEEYERDFVFCVFDQDSHHSFVEAIQQAETINKSLQDSRKAVVFRAIPSVPCFEIWLLMHYIPVTREIERTEVSRKLKEHLRGYKKACDFAYERTAHLVETAFQNAAAVKRNKAYLDDSQSRRPYTEVDDVVRKLKNL